MSSHKHNPEIKLWRGRSYRRGGERVRELRTTNPHEIADGVAEHQDHVVRGGLWYHDRLAYLGPESEWDARTRHHHGRRRSASVRQQQVSEQEETRSRRKFYWACARMGMKHSDAVAVWNSRAKRA